MISIFLLCFQWIGRKSELGVRTVLSAIFTCLLVGCAHQLPQESADTSFNFASDHFAFANETVWHYQNGHLTSTDSSEKSSEKRAYSRRCFVLARAAVQFWKFARFAPDEAIPSPTDLAARIREVTSRDVWSCSLPPSKRVVFGGYRNVYDLSKKQAAIMEDNLGLGWPTYFRPGNYSIVFPPTRAHQARTDDELKANIAKHYPTILWLVNFPSLSINHTVVVYACEPSALLDTFEVYDPNNFEKPETLTYDSRTRTFSFNKTFYFPGGTVDVRPVYLSDFQ